MEAEAVFKFTASTSLVITTYRNETEALNLDEVVTEFVSKSQTHCNKFVVQV